MIKKTLIAGGIIGSSILLSGVAATMLTISALGLKPLTAQDEIVRCEFLNEDDSLLYTANVTRGEMPVYEGPTPEKASDKTYSYRFSGWDEDLKKVYTDMVYHAQFEAEIKQFTVTFVGAASEVLSSQSFAAGAVPYYSGTTPVKAADDTYSYTFTGWDKAFAPIYEDTTYVAEFSASKVLYDVDFTNYDDSLLYTDHVVYNGTASYKGQKPTRPDDSQYHYTFKEWDRTLVGITKKTTIKAIYSAEAISFTVTFKNYDGSILYVDKVVTGSSVVYKGATPTRPTDSEFVYTFSGWDHSLESITSDLTVTALFSTSAPQFTVTFKNYDGEVLGTSTVDIGTTAVYTGDTPTKPEDEKYTYTFSGWDRSLDNVTKDFYTVAQFDSTLKEFTVTFCNWEKTELGKVKVPYGSPATYTGTTPTREADENYTYTFKGWNEDLSSITKNLTTYAVFTPVPIPKSTGDDSGESGGKGSGTGGSTGEDPGKAKSDDLFTVTFRNWDTKYLDADVTVRGGKAYYDSETPTREADSKHKIYTFTSWDKNIASVQHSFTTFAQYTVDDDFMTQYIVSFRNDVGSLLYEDVVEEGDMPSYKSPTAPTSGQAGTWLFKEWDRPLVPATKSYTVYGIFKMVEPPADGKISSHPNEPKKTEVFHYNTSYSGNVYFRECSYGDFKNDLWTDAPSYTIPSGGINPIYFTSKSLEAASATAYSLNLTYGTDRLNAFLPNYSKTVLSAPTGDAACGTNETSPQAYDFQPFTLDATNSAALSLSSSPYASQEADYRTFVKENYLAVSEEEKSYFTQLAQDNGLTADTPEALLNDVKFISSAAKYNLNFASYPTGVDYVLYFLKTAKEGTCGHFASALTLLLRSLGKPARFASGYLSKATLGEEVSVLDENAHAWCEVYLDGIGWVSLDATPAETTDPTEPDPTKPTDPTEPETPTDSDADYDPFGTPVNPTIFIEVAPESERKVYDGQPMKVTATYTGTLNSGDRLDFNIAEMGYDVGTYTVQLKPKIYDSNGKDVTSSYRSKVQITRQTYTIDPRPITIATDSASKTRDGTPLSKNSFTLTSGTLVVGQTISVNFLGSQEKPGSSENLVDLTSFHIFDSAGKDQSKNYQVEWTYGTLTVM